MNIINLAFRGGNLYHGGENIRCYGKQIHQEILLETMCSLLLL